MILIRKASLADMESIIDILKPHYDINNLIEDFWVCEAEGIICGCGCAVLEEDKCYIGGLSVKENYRNSGCGSAILKALLNSAELKGIKDAFAAGSCRNFFIKLRFEPLTDSSEVLRVKLAELFGEADYNNIYHAALHDYFIKSCKGTC